MLNTKPATQLEPTRTAARKCAIFLASVQHKSLRNSSPLLCLVSAVSGMVLAATIAVSTGLGQWGLFWFGALIGGNVTRAVIRHSLLLSPKNELNSSRASRLLAMGNLLDGLIWGTAWLLLPQDPSFTGVAFIGFSLVGLQACVVALATKTEARPTFFSYTILANIGFLVFIISTDIEYQNLVIAAYVMYLSLIIPIAKRVGIEPNNIVKLKIRNEALTKNFENSELSLRQTQSDLNIQKNRNSDLEYQQTSALKKLVAASEEKDLLIDSLEEGIFQLNRFGEFTYSNSSARKLLQFDNLELLGQSAISFLNASLAPHENALKTNFLIGNCYLEDKKIEKLDSIFSGANGVRLSVRFSCRSVIKDNAVIGALVSFTDMTKQREMEKMLFQTQKMEAIGRLTSGVSHDFNNLLTIIMGNIEFLKRRLSDNADVKGLLNRILEIAGRGAKLNRRLLSFSGEDSFEAEIVDVNLVIQEMYDFLIRSLGERVSLTLELCKEVCLVKVDRAQLENALLNLCVNARDAMPQGGCLKIDTQLNPEDLYNYDYKLNKYADETVLICVTDNGTGISSENLKHVFEPFYTTKKSDHGTGLGLSNAYQFFKHSGGNIVVESRQWEWTRFRISLPKSELQEPSAKLEIIKPRWDEQMSGLVLVVEDDEDLRKIASAMLTASGFDVVVAEDGIRGLALFKSTPNIDFVFSDIVMPGGINGIQLAEGISKMSPKTPIILVTGYADKATKRHIPVTNNIVCISKPYDINEIPSVVNKMITEARPYE
jgi:signal transduction histidine kinase/CheY-like chemotaxis protein